MDVTEEAGEANLHRVARLDVLSKTRLPVQRLGLNWGIRKNQLMMGKCKPGYSSNCEILYGKTCRVNIARTHHIRSHGTALLIFSSRINGTRLTSSISCRGFARGNRTAPPPKQTWNPCRLLPGGQEPLYGLFRSFVTLRGGGGCSGRIGSPVLFPILQLHS